MLFDAGMSDWGVAFWLTEPMDFVGDKRPIDVLNDEDTFKQVLARAKPMPATSERLTKLAKSMVESSRHKHWPWIHFTFLRPQI